MKRIAIIFVGWLLASALAQSGATACTTFQLNHQGRILVGKNYDWMVSDGLVMLNQRGMKKTAMESITDNTGLGTPATWTAKYGSITFNQVSRDQPAGGMNEKGLVVESMSLPGSKYPEPDDRPSVLMLQWTQYQLDNFATVKEVMDSDAKIRVRPKKGVCIHWLVSDNQGNCATVEFLESKLVCHFNEKLPHKALTNSIYAQSVEFLAQNKIPDPDRFKSIERFIKAANMVKDFDAGKVTAPPLDYAFDILKSVSWSVASQWKGIPFTTNTHWSIVYDATNMVIHFKTLDNQNIRSVKMDGFDFSCASPAKIFEINTKTSGDVTGKFVDYTRKAHRNMIETALTKIVYMPKFPPEVFDRMAGYPDSFTCEQ